MSVQVKEGVEASIKELSEAIAGVPEKFVSFDKKVDQMSGENQEKFEKLDIDLKERDDANQKLVLELQENKKSESELKERMVDLEKSLSFKSTGSDVPLKERPEYKAFNYLLAKGKDSIVIADQKELDFDVKYLRTDIGPEGGFRVPDVMFSEILKEVEEISDVRRLSRVKSIKTKSLMIPIRDSIPTATFEGEAEENELSQSSWRNETLTASRQTFTTPITRDQIAFDGYDIMSDMQGDAVIAFAQGEGRNALTGTGVEQMQGILDTSAGVETIDSISSGALELGDANELFGSLKTGYNPAYFFNRRTLTVLRFQKGDDGHPIWKPGDQDTNVNALWSLPYVIMQDMPNIEIGAKPIGLGDFSRGYCINDALGMEIIRDEVTEARKARINFTWHRYLDGRVVFSEAFKLIKIKS